MLLKQNTSFIELMTHIIWKQHVKSHIYDSKRQYYNDIINQNKHNLKKLWTGLNELSGYKSKVQTHFIDDDDGNPVTDPLSLQIYSINNLRISTNPIMPLIRLVMKILSCYS
jgi:hypothetical protein